MKSYIPFTQYIYKSPQKTETLEITETLSSLKLQPKKKSEETQYPEATAIKLLKKFLSFAKSKSKLSN